MKIVLSWWNVSLGCIKLSEYHKLKAKADYIRQLFQWLSCLRFHSLFLLILRILSINTWEQAVLVVNQCKKLTLHVGRLTFPQVSASSSNNSEVKTTTESVPLSYWNKGFSKFSIKRQFRQKRREENHKSGQWTDPKKSEHTIIHKIELLIIEQAWHYMVSKTWWQAIFCKSLSMPTWIKFINKSCRNWCKISSNLKKSIKTVKIAQLQITKSDH